MPNVIQRDYLVGLTRNTTWNTAPVGGFGANDGIHILAEDLGVPARESLPDDSLGARRRHLEQSVKGNYPLESKSITQYLRADESERMIALACGTANTLLHATGAMDHTIIPAGSLDGVFGSMVMEKQDGAIVHGYPSIKFDGFELNGEAGQFYQLVYQVHNARLQQAMVTTTLMNSVTPRTESNLCVFDRTRLWIGDQSGATLAAANLVKPSSLSFKYARGNEAYNAACGEVDGNEAVMQEPADGEYPEVMLELEFPTKTADTWVTDLGNDTRKKAHLYLDFGYAAGALATYGMHLYMPHLEIIDNGEVTDGPGKVTQPLSFKVLGTESAVNGMSRQDPFWFVFRNTIQTGLLVL
jgi:hypothetical protein